MMRGFFGMDVGERDPDGPSFFFGIVRPATAGPGAVFFGILKAEEEGGGGATFFIFLFLSASRSACWHLSLYTFMFFL